MRNAFIDLVTNHDLALQTKVLARIQQVIGQSFVADGSRMTGDEIKRRFALIEIIIRECREDCGWAFERILDELPVALRSRLDGGTWQPNTRTVWAGST